MIWWILSNSRQLLTYFTSAHIVDTRIFCIFSIFTEVNKHHQCQMEITRIGRHLGKWNGIGWDGWLNGRMGGVMWVASPWRFAFYETISKCETNSHKILPARLWHVKWNQIRKWSRTHWVREIKYIKINVNINAVCPSGVYWHFGKRKSRRACEFPWEVDIVIVFVLVVIPATGGKHIWKPLAHVLMNDVLMWQTAMYSFCIYFFYVKRWVVLWTVM